MDKAYNDLKLDFEYLSTLSEEERINAIVEAYYKIMFSTKETTMVKDKAELAYKVLRDPAYKNYYEKNNDVEEKHGIRR